MLTDTHCPYCALQCAMTLAVGAPSAAGPPTVEVRPRDFPTNLGGLCRKGWTAAELLAHPDRLTSPLARAVPGDRTSALTPVGWDEALQRVAAAALAARRAGGPDSVAVFGGGGLTN
jgi:assimilatory nitrate reductase catalytic subunit